jgi:hypothetical protein
MAAGYLYFLTNSFFLVISDQSAKPFDTDFTNLWTAAKLVQSGHIMTLFNIDGFRAAQATFFGQPLTYLNEWSYPPHFLPWITWLGFLPFPVALAAWMGLTGALYLFAVVYKRPQSGKLALILVLAPASFTSILYGQNGFLVAALLAGGLRLLDKKPALAGALFGFLTIKPQLALSLPFALFFGRYWRVIAATVLAAAVLIGGSLVFYGLEPWKAYFALSIPYHQKMIEGLLPQTHLALVTPYFAARVLGAPVWLAYALAIIVAFIAILAVAYAFRKARSADMRNAVALTSLFLITPYAQIYDLPILNAAIVSMAASFGSRAIPLGQIPVIMLAWLLPIYAMMMNKAGLPLAPVIIGALLAVEIWWIKRQSEN